MQSLIAAVSHFNQRIENFQYIGMPIYGKGQILHILIGRNTEICGLEDAYSTYKIIYQLFASRMLTIVGTILKKLRATLPNFKYNFSKPWFYIYLRYHTNNWHPPDEFVPTTPWRVSRDNQSPGILRKIICLYNSPVKFRRLASSCASEIR